MFSTVLSWLRIREVRSKLLLTIVLLAVYRLGFSIVLSVVDQDSLAESLKTKDGDGGAIALLSMLSASNVGMMTIFGLGIMPYISSSIIFQLLGTVYPPIEALQKEGDVGRRKINEYTRYCTVVICLVQSFVWLNVSMRSSDGGGLVLAGFGGPYLQFVCAVTMTAGSVLLMWIGEQIDEFGLGNGISLLIMAGILGRVPEVVASVLQPAVDQGVMVGSQSGVDKLIALALLFVSVVGAVVLVTQAQRRVQLHSARHARSLSSGSQGQFLPLKINQSGVMPVIFASSLMVFPLLLLKQLVAVSSSVPLLQAFFLLVDGAMSDSAGVVYNTLFVMLVYFFCYFWSAVSFNPVEVANNLRDHGVFVPGYRPGARTASYLEQVISRLNFMGATFLSVVAMIPVFVMNFVGVDYLVASFFGGTSLLICVSVAIDLVQKIEGYAAASGTRGT
ncbi:MAG: preprotein translocase subunit SecY [Planctomycetales bacterium]|nr:preprotein translocase subunit SecY [Planctomycetales bacterium]